MDRPHHLCPGAAQAFYGKLFRVDVRGDDPSWRPRYAIAKLAWNFSDLHTDDPDGINFYLDVVGWDIERSPHATTLRVPGDGDHREATVDPDIRVRQADAPPGFADVIGGVDPDDRGIAPHWHITFTVADRDEAAAVAERLGATVLGSEADEWTRRALIRDPQGAVFSASQFTPPDQSSFGDEVA